MGGLKTLSISCALLAAVIFTFEYHGAYAGAWVTPNKQTQIIVGANSLSSDPKQKFAIEFYASKGISENNAIIISQNIKFYNELPTISETEVSIHSKLLKTNKLVVSSRIGMNTNVNPFLNKRVNNLRTSLLVGYDFQSFWGNFEAGYTKCINHTKITSETAFGKHINKADMIIAKYYLNGCDYNYYGNRGLQITYVKKISANLNVEFGVRQMRAKSEFNNIANNKSGAIITLWKNY